MFRLESGPHSPPGRHEDPPTSPPPWHEVHALEQASTPQVNWDFQGQARICAGKEAASPWSASPNGGLFVGGHPEFPFLLSFITTRLARALVRSGRWLVGGDWALPEPCRGQR